MKGGGCTASPSGQFFLELDFRISTGGTLRRGSILAESGPLPAPTIDYQRLSPLARMRFTSLLQALVACEQLLCSIEQFLGRPTASQLVRQPCWMVIAPEMVGQRVQGRVDLQYLSRAPRFCVNYLRVKHWRLQCQCSSLRRLPIFETADATIL